MQFDPLITKKKKKPIITIDSISVAHPSAAVLKSPNKLGLYATRNFYVNYHDENNDEKSISLGVWHILPNYIAKKFSSELGLNAVNFIPSLLFGKILCFRT